MVDVKVQVVGGYSLCIVIPKAIAELKGIKKGMIMSLEETLDGDLLIRKK